MTSETRPEEPESQPKQSESFAETILKDIDLSGLPDERWRECVRQLLNMVESLTGELRKAQAENQYLREQLKRGKGGPDGPSQLESNSDGQGQKPRDSEKERGKRGRKWKKRTKLDRVHVDREQELSLPSAVLPADAEFKGYETVVVQDLRIHTDNVKFLKAKYYSASERKTYLAPLPAGYNGEFGPGVKAVCLVFGYACNMTEPKIAQLLENFGIQISAGQISRLLIGRAETFHREKAEVVEAGLRSSPWQHLDDTPSRVEGKNWHCQVVCNPLFTAYFTTERKDRLTVIDVLRNQRERVYRINEETAMLLGQNGAPQKVLEAIQQLPRDRDLSEAVLEVLLHEHLPGLGATSRHAVREAAAIAAYHAQTEHPVVRLLLTDDAKQFKRVTEELALCWIHDGRQYKSLEPCVRLHQNLLKEFLQQYWDFYKQLRDYRQAPGPEHAARLSQQFDRLFSTATGYRALDQRISRTQEKKPHLLMALRHPEIPLHNNPAELGARLRVRKRVISYGTRSPQGTQAWDTFHTLLGTAKKLGVNFFQYIRDHVSGTPQTPSLAQLIDERAKALNLGASWAPL
jgi:Transposase IS66 family